jgi:hypothetical protein
MTQQQDIVQGDALQKIGGAGFIVGAILMALGGLLMPYAAKSTSNVREMLTPLGENEFSAQMSSLLMMIGIWAMMVGATGLCRTITVGGAAWARQGSNFILVGTATWTASLASDVATASAVAKWLAAPIEAKEATWSVVAALNAVGRGLYPSTIIVYWLAYAYLGIAMILSAVYPRWLGWAGLILSMPGVALGVIQIFTERSTTLTLGFAVLSLLTTLWAFVVGIWVARKAWSQAIMSGPEPETAAAATKTISAAKPSV